MYEWLRDYQEIEQDVLYLEFELRRNKKELERWVQGDLSEVKLSEKSKSSKLEETIQNKEYELAHKMNDLYDAKKLISHFEGLDNKILFKKYVEGKTLEVAAFELNYSYNYIKSKHAQMKRIIKFAEKVTSQ